MQVSLEKISNIMCRLTIVIPRDEIENTYRKQIHQFAEKVNIKGFRPGKVPISYVEQRFGAKVRDEAMADVIQNAVNKAISEKKLQPISQPKVEPKIMGPEDPLEVIASFEVLPEIEKINASLDQIEKPVVDISEADVDDAILRLQKQYTKWTLVDRPAKENDRVVITYYPIVEGNPDLNQKVVDYSLALGSHVMISGFEDGLIGAKANEKRILNLHYPDDYSEKEKASQPVDFEVEIKQVFEADMPSINEQFVKSLGVKSGSEEEMKKQIRQTLEFNRDRLIRENIKEQIFPKLLEQNTIEVPNALIDHVSKNIHDEIYQHQEHQHHDHSDKELTTFNDLAKKRITVSLLISAFAKQLNLSVDKERVRERVREIAASYENPTEVTKWLLSKERIGDIESQVLEDQVLDKLLETTSVTEKSMSYKDLVEKIG